MTDSVDAGRTVLLQKVNELRVMCKQSGDVGPNVCFIRRCEEKCDLADKSLVTERSVKKGSLIDAARHYIQAVLDFTFVEENDLVDNCFPEAVAKDKVHNILVTIPDAGTFVNDIFGDGADESEVLGVEILECIHWRRGALLYMYCHTINQDASRLQGNLPHFIQISTEGVNHLSKMLNTRTTVLDDVISSNDETMKLIQQGIFSDTHLLALMYAGELCYWHSIATKHQPHTTSLVDSGKQFLQKFINIVNGPMKGMGWQCSRAEELLKELNSNVT